MEQLQNIVLETLASKGHVENSLTLYDDNGNVADQQRLLGVLKSLSGLNMVQYEAIEKDGWRLSEEALMILKHGSHEARVFNMIPEGDRGIDLKSIQQALGEIGKIGQSKAFKK